MGKSYRKGYNGYYFITEHSKRWWWHSKGGITTPKFYKRQANKKVRRYLKLVGELQNKDYKKLYESRFIVDCRWWVKLAEYKHNKWQIKNK